MSFNFIDFLVFFCIVYGLYLLIPPAWQNRLLLAASFLFYSAWGWQFIPLLLLVTLTGYFCGLKIEGSTTAKEKKLFLVVSIIVCFGTLGFFKYFNFLLFNVLSLFKALGCGVTPHVWDIAVPMGISFYIFKTMSYPIDIYWKRMKATRNLLDFALFVSFFPELIAGPIQRARDLLPQIASPRKVSLDNFYEGCFLFYWGLFLKLFVADNLSKIVAGVFDGNSSSSGGEVLMAANVFFFQLFCDFEGYSSMARGLGKMMGFEIPLNFNLPLFAMNIQDFWGRWHITLTSWIKDYLYVPLFDSLKMIKGDLRVYITLLVSMIAIGIWHGAQWTFFLFGVYSAFLLITYTILRTKFHIKRYVQPKSRLGQLLWLWARILFTFQIVSLGLIIFRAQSLSQMGFLCHQLFFRFTGGDPSSIIVDSFLFTLPVLAVQIGQYITGDLMFLYRLHWLPKTILYAIMLFLIIGWGVMKPEEFIYFRF